MSMLFGPITHIVLLATAVVGTAILGLTLARQKTWAAVLLWIVPIAAALSTADLVLALAASSWPHLAMDGGEGDWVRFVVAFVMMLIPCELLYQGIAGAMAGAGTTHRRAVDRALGSTGSPAHSEPGDNEPQGPDAGP